MDLRFAQDENFSTYDEKSKNLILISKAENVEESMIDKIIQIIDESGNEVNCTVNKFIEIFDTYGLEGFLL